MNIDKFHIKRVSFPHEHGAWGFFLEPLILALLVAYSVNGLFLVVSSFFFFLAHQPIRILSKRNSKHTIFSAVIFLAFYLSISFLLLFFLYSNSENYTFLVSYLIAIALMIFYLIMELKNFNRTIWIEMVAPISIVLIAISLPVINHWSISSIAALGIILLSRSVPTVLYVNNKLKFFKGNKANIFIVHFLGTLFLIATLILSLLKLGPALAVVANAMLIARVYVGFLPKNKKEKIKTLGIKEFLFGFLFVIINAIGYLLKI